ncbi:MAG: hypothetical protein QHH75_03415 [Bacillota bacterium]|nr:hypothetical protein [Bacillota bacterium]
MAAINVFLEGFLLSYVGPTLLGFRPCAKKVLLGGIVTGGAGFFFRSLADLHYIPLGAHTLLGVLVLTLVLRFALPAPWGIASAASLLSFTLLLLTGTLTVFGAVLILGLDLKEILADPPRRFLVALLEDLPLGMLALLCWSRGFRLFRIETGDQDVSERL